MPKVSVIIPVYNVEKYLKRCLDSVCKQTLQDLEIICVNDCSPDNSINILNDYAAKDKRIKVINFTKNKGVAVARNSGMDSATGQYLAFLDSDDWLDLDFYEKLYNKALLKDSDLAIGNIKELRGNELKSFPFLEKIKQNKHHFMGLFVLGLYKKSLLNNHGIKFIEGITIGEDRLLPIVSSITANNIVIVDDTFYNYNKNSENSVTMQSSYSDKNFDDFFVSTKQVFDFLKLKNTPEDIYKIYAEAFLEQLIELFLGLDTMIIDKYKNNILFTFNTISEKYVLKDFFKNVFLLYQQGDYKKIKAEFMKKRILDKIRTNMQANKKG